MNKTIQELWNRIPLREKKSARIKIGLKDALLELLLEKSFADISVKELCERVEISEGTFFNYFSEKNYLLVYFVQLWSIEVQSVARRLTAKENGLISGLGIIYKVFEYSAQQIRQNPAVIGEILAFQAKNPNPQPMEISLAEKLMAFPDLPDVESYPAHGIGPIIEEALKNAVENGELSPKIDLSTAGIHVAAIFFGIPLILGPKAMDSLATIWAKCLETLFQGLKG